MAKRFYTQRQHKITFSSLFYPKENDNLWRRSVYLSALCGLLLFGSIFISFPLFQAVASPVPTNLTAPLFQDTLIPLRDVEQVASGGAHTCVLTNDGTVLCWGNNSSGQLGDGTNIDRGTPVKVNGLPNNVVAISAGYYHTCALVRDGSALCWGLNDYGQVGNGTDVDSDTPIAIFARDVAAISTGAFYTCALFYSGGAKCWGDNEFGQLGDGTTTNRATPTDVGDLIGNFAAIVPGFGHTCAVRTDGSAACWGSNSHGQIGNATVTDSLLPTAVGGINGALREISVGENHTCAVLMDGAVMCWGKNSSGQLGDGTYTDRKSPVFASTLPTSNVTAISVGADHSCAQLSSGGMLCWGNNFVGQNGDGSGSDNTKPVEVSALANTVAAISAGAYHSCALINDGGVTCWGYNGHGRLGNGTPVQRSRPMAVIDQPSDVTALAAGGNHTCLLTENGSVYCWGHSDSGLLGDETFMDRSIPAEAINITQSVTAISAGKAHNCAVMDGGSVRCWGANSRGQLGNNSTESSSTPVDVNNLGSGVVAISAGQYHTCAIANDGAASCWGNNFNGQLGNGTTIQSTVPVTVSGLATGTVAIAAGYGHTCALTTDDEVLCWGRNSEGQLGDGTTTGSDTPVKVSGLAAGVTNIVAGGYYTCAVTDDGLFCWGSNYVGQVGDGTNIDAHTPVKVMGLTNSLLKISAGGYHTCVLTDTDDMLCWGRNDAGSLGDGTNTNRSNPVFVSGLPASAIVEISTGNKHTCALTENDEVLCWGRDSNGQLGSGRLLQSLTPVDVMVSATCYALTLNHEGEGAAPIALPANSLGCNAGTYIVGEALSLTADPADGWQVARWSGTNSDSSTMTTNSLTMPASAHAVGLTYGEIPSTSTPVPPTSTAVPPTVQPNGDYEENDECQAANPISINGAAQEQTFHDAADVDWISFDVVAGTTYRIEVATDVDSLADVDLELYANCDQAATEQEAPSFNPGIQLDYEAPQSGSVKLRLANFDANIFGPNASYTLLVRSLEETDDNKALIIVAGRLKGTDRLQTNIHEVTTAVYNLFQSKGYSDDDIYYLATNSSLPGYDVAATNDALRLAITDWAKGRLSAGGALTLYLIDHGSPDLFYIDEASGQRVTPSELNDWLTELESEVPELKTNVFIEACQSGSFIDPENGTISKPGRIIITSTNAQNDAKASTSGAYFSDHFLTGLHLGETLATSFDRARGVARSIYDLQESWIDADGDGIPNEFEDAALSANRSFVNLGTLSSNQWAPHIFAVNEPEAIENFSGTIQVDVRDDLKVAQVYAVVYPPDYVPEENIQELQAETLPSFILTPTGEPDQFAGVYTGFTQSGAYRIVIHAIDSGGLVATPREVTVQFAEQTSQRQLFLPTFLR